MKKLICLIVCVLGVAGAFGQEKNLNQSYSSKVGFYAPSDGLNNGLLIGIDGITEFLKYDFFLSGTADLYLKQSISHFKQPQPDITRQQMILIPLHIGVGYELADVADADTRLYAGGGAGYYLYFYTVEYSTTGSGGLLGGLPRQETASHNGGNLFGTVFARLLIGQIFIEPRFYFASKSEESTPGGHTYVVNPGGFAISLGFQTK